MKQPDKPARTPIAYGYSRVSLAKQVEKGLSLEDQTADHLRYYQFKLEPKGVLWGNTFVDSERKNGRKGVSGKTRFIERVAGRELWMRAQPGDHVIFTRLDRGFRSFRDAIDVLETWIEKGIYIHFTRESIDTTTDGGLTFLRLMAVFADFVRMGIAERTSEAMRHRKRTGGVVNQYPGYGRRLDGQKGHRRIAEDPNELKVMAAIADMIDVRGMSYDEVYLVLLKSNVKTRSDKSWSRGRIWRAYKSFKNPSASSALKPPTTNGRPS